MQLEDEFFRPEENNPWDPHIWLFEHRDIAETLWRVDSQRLMIDAKCSYQDALDSVPDVISEVDIWIGEKRSGRTLRKYAGPFEVYGYGALRRIGKGSLDDTKDLDSCTTLFDDEKALMMRRSGCERRITRRQKVTRRRLRIGSQRSSICSSNSFLILKIFASRRAGRKYRSLRQRRLSAGFPCGR
jgi:hypothetical protein